MNTNRRSFLKCVGAAGALAAAAGLPPASAAAAERNLKKAIMYGTVGYKGSVLEQFKALKEAGFEGVEPMSHMNANKVAAALEATGLKAASVCGALHWKKPLSDPDPKVRQEGLEALKQTLRDANRYGASSVLLVPLVVNPKLNREECVQRLAGRDQEGATCRRRNRREDCHRKRLEGFLQQTRRGGGLPRCHRQPDGRLAF